MGKYDDIINMKHPISGKHKPMDIMDRAAQFAPFSAVTGHEKLIDETARLTYDRVELEESAKAEIDEALQNISRDIKSHPTVSVTYFVPDKSKNGGDYVSYDGVVKKIDMYERIIMFQDGMNVNIDDVKEILL